MPKRFPPECPQRPVYFRTKTQERRYDAALRAWRVGEALRTLAIAKAAQRHVDRSIADDFPYLGSPRLDTPTSHSLNADGSPRSMDGVCAWIDAQMTRDEALRSISAAYTRLSRDMALYAQVAWYFHVDLWTHAEIAAILRTSERTVVRYLGVANLRLYAAMREQDGWKTAQREARRLWRDAEDLEAKTWQAADMTEETAFDEEVLAGVRPPETHKPAKTSKDVA